MPTRLLSPSTPFRAYQVPQDTIVFVGDIDTFQLVMEDLRWFWVLEWPRRLDAASDHEYWIFPVPPMVTIDELRDLQRYGLRFYPPGSVVIYPV